MLRGHAVRATYLSAGATDVAVETDDAELLAALRRQWDATVARRTYLTGGMGSRHQDEAFGEDFVLPADRAYSETCAGVGSIMFSWRLLLAGGDARYADLIERTLYNVIATSPSRDGKRFFYANTLHLRELGAEPDAEQAVGRAESTLRAPWFGVSCCPTNLARTFASLDAYVASGGRRRVSSCTSSCPPRSAPHFPTGGRSPCGWRPTTRRTAHVRSGSAVRASGTVDAVATDPALGGRGGRRHRERRRGGPRPGGLRPAVTEDFQPGDVVELTLPMQPRFTIADPRVDAVRGCVAVERGPEVLCLESVDTPENVHVDLVQVDDSVKPREEDGAVLVRVRTRTPPDAEPAWPYREHRSGTAGHGLDTDGTTEVALRPYHSWGNRGPTTMRVWLPTTSS